MGREDETPDPDLRAVVTSDTTVPVLPLLTAGFLILDVKSSLLFSSPEEERGLVAHSSTFYGDYILDTTSQGLS